MQITLKFSDGTLINYGDNRTEEDRAALWRCIQKGLHRDPIYATAWDPEKGHRQTGQIALAVRVNDEQFDTVFNFIGIVEEEWGNQG